MARPSTAHRIWTRQKRTSIFDFPLFVTIWPDYGMLTAQSDSMVLIDQSNLPTVTILMNCLSHFETRTDPGFVIGFR